MTTAATAATVIAPRPGWRRALRHGTPASVNAAAPRTRAR
jgi:hypothetical protein